MATRTESNGQPEETIGDIFNRLRAKNEELRAQLAVKDAEIAFLNKNADLSYECLMARDADINNYVEQLKAKDAEIARLRAIIQWCSKRLKSAAYEASLASMLHDPNYGRDIDETPMVHSAAMNGEAR